MSDQAYETIRRTYPRPIARAVVRARNAVDHGEAAKLVRNAFETTLHYIVLTGCARALPPTEDVAGPDLSLLQSERVSLGHWAQLIHELDRTLVKRGEKVLGEDLRAQRDDLPRCLDLVRRVDPEFKRQRVGFAELFGRITNLRNLDAHAGALSLTSIVNPLREAVEEILVRLPILSEWDIVLVNKVNVLKSGMVADCHLFCGDGEGERKLFEFGMQTKAHDGALCLRHRPTDRWVELTPFVLMHERNLYFFKGLKQGDPVYLCPDGPLLGPARQEQVLADLRSRAPGLFLVSESASLVEHLEPFVRATAADGLINAAELAFLEGEVARLDPATDTEKRRSIVDAAIRRFAPDARVEDEEQDEPEPPVGGDEESDEVEEEERGASFHPPSIAPPSGDLVDEDLETVILACLDEAEEPLTRNEVVLRVGCTVRDGYKVLTSLRDRWELLQYQRRGPSVRYARPARMLPWLLSRAGCALAKRDILDQIEMAGAQWKHVMTELVDEGVIEVSGAGAGRYYALPGTGAPQGDPAGPSGQPEDKEAWVAASEAFLRRMLTAVAEKGLGFDPLHVTPHDEVGELDDGWMWVGWEPDEQRALMVSIGRKKLTRVTVAVAFQSRFARRDPVFRHVCRGLGVRRAGDRVTLAGAVFEFRHGALALESRERVEVSALADDGLFEAVMKRLRVLAAEVVPRLASAEHAAEDDED